MILGSIDPSIITTTITQAALLLGLFITANRGKKDRADKQDQLAEKIEVINKKIKTNHGKTIGEHIEHMTESIDKIWVKLDHAGPARLSALIDLASDGILIGDTNGHVTYANERACKLLGMSLSEILENGWLNAIHPEDKARVFKESRDYIDEGRTFDMNYKILHKNGDVITIHGRGRAVYDHKDEIIGYMGVISQV